MCTNKLFINKTLQYFIKILKLSILIHGDFKLEMDSAVVLSEN